MSSFELRLCGQEFTINRSDVVIYVEGCYMLKIKKLANCSYQGLPIIPKSMARKFITHGVMVESRSSNVKGVHITEYRFRKSPYKLDIEV